MDTFLRRVAATIARHRMIAPGDTVLVAYSAGADSTALLHALVQLRKKLGCHICACHVHHGLRGGDADADAEHAAGFAESLGVPFTSARADARAYAKERKLSTETAAREVRYQLLEQAARDHSAARIATGHTADDQAETVLLNLLRGAGPAGLAGIPPVRGNIIRPLIDTEKHRIKYYCDDKRLKYRRDRSNRDMRFARNRVRHRILPVIRQFQPSVVDVLCRVAWIMRDENQVMVQLAECAAKKLGLTEDSLHDRSIPIRDLADLSPALRRRIARCIIALAKGSDRDIGANRVEAFYGMLTWGNTGAQIGLPGGLTALRTYREVLIQRSAGTKPPPTGEWSLPPSGEIEVKELGFGFTLTSSTSKRLPQTPHTALLDAAAVTGPLRIRTWRPGDRFVPLGMTRSVKLQDFFVNAKVPRALRPWVPLVVCGDRIAWIVGHRISDEFKVTARTRRTIRIEAAEHFIIPSED